MFLFNSIATEILIQWIDIEHRERKERILIKGNEITILEVNVINKEKISLCNNKYRCTSVCRLLRIGWQESTNLKKQKQQEE